MSLTFIPLVELPSDKEFLSEKTLQSFPLFSDYYKEYYGDAFKDLSFAVFDENKFIGYVICGFLNSVITMPDGGINIVLKDEQSDKEQKKIYTHILEYLIKIANDCACYSIIVKDSIINASLSPLGNVLFNQRFESRLTLEMNIPFHGESLAVSLRKSYKSLINWGRRELKTEFINKDNLDRKKFNAFQEFHHKISGKVTRSQATWDAQYHMLEEGLGELILSTYKGQLAAGSIFTDYGDTSIYFTGVYERDLFDFGISHFILHEGIHRSYNRYQTSKFSLGYFDTAIKDPKWYNIQFFKKGFCKELTPVIFWSKKVTDE